MQIVWISNVIVFPPLFQGTATGICNIFARVVLFFSPQAAELPAPYPMEILMLLCCIAIIAALNLKLIYNSK